jgi:antirestriction protein ArdC
MDIYAAVTDRIIAQMEPGVIPWSKPWVSNGKAVSHATGKPYSLLNQMLLGRPGEYLTFKQCQEAGGKVKKGEKSSLVVFWKWIEQEDEETGETKEVPFLRYYNVFHIDQCEGIQTKYTTEAHFPDGAFTVETAQEIIYDYLEREGVKLTHSEGDRAFYQPLTDSITLPLLAQFRNTAEYYSTAFHETVHVTGHHSRLNRLEKTAFFGSEAYSKEELIAEIGAAALVNHTGLETPDSFRNSAAYIQNWLQVLKNDKRFIVSASTKAEKAVNMILGTAG